jgi:hypothetical protein
MNVLGSKSKYLIRLIQTGAVIQFFALLVPALADLAAGKRALKDGDYATAQKELLPLAKQGDPDAEVYLGSVYGATGDYAQAILWFRKAADQGHAEAQDTLGTMYERGLGVTQDYRAAAAWYLKAANQGNVHAQASLGSMYTYGHGVPQDYIEAHMWLNLAGSAGEKDCIQERDHLAARMTPEQIAEAQHLAREWNPATHAEKPAGMGAARVEAPPSQLLAETPYEAEGAPSDDDLRTLIAYGRTFPKPDQLYEGGGLPESVSVGVSSGRAVRFMTDRAIICIEACRAKLLLKPFEVADARAIFNPNRLHAILEATSITRNGFAHANKQFGGEDLNLILSVGGEMLQPLAIGAPRGGTAGGVQLTQVSRVGRGFYTVNTLDLTPGYLSRAFTFELPSPAAGIAEVNLILVDSKGKQKRFSANLSPLRADTKPGIAFDYPFNGAVKPGKPFSFRVHMDSGQGASKVLRAESIWRAPEAKGALATKIKDLPPESVFSFHPDEQGGGGLLKFDLPTDGLAPGKYQLRVLVGGHETNLFFGVRD